jgi:hypothetical protein
VFLNDTSNIGNNFTFSHFDPLHPTICGKLMGLLCKHVDLEANMQGFSSGAFSRVGIIPLLIHTPRTLKMPKYRAL